MPTRRILVRGRVQGVSYRLWALDEAQALGLSGWVRNRSDGSVEILASGRQEQITELTVKCWTGPELARVDNVDVLATDESVAEGFEQRRTV